MKKLLLIISTLFLIACSNTIEKKEWQSPKKLKENLEVLKVGDIIIAEKQDEFLSWFGHCGIVVNNLYISEIPKLGTELMYTPIKNWLEKDRKIIVLRLKDVNNEFRNDLMVEIDKKIKKPYKVSINKKNKNGFYCSSFIYLVYENVAQKHNINIKLDSDGGIFIFPYDIIYSEDLKQILLK